MEKILATEIICELQSNLEEKVNPSILKDDFLLKTIPTYFHINSTSVTKLVKLILAVATDQMPDHI